MAVDGCVKHICQTQDGCTALIRASAAVEYGWNLVASARAQSCVHTGCVRLLLMAGADKDATDNVRLRPIFVTFIVA